MIPAGFYHQFPPSLFSSKCLFIQVEIRVPKIPIPAPKSAAVAAFIESNKVFREAFAGPFVAAFSLIGQAVARLSEIMAIVAKALTRSAD